MRGIGREVCYRNTKPSGPNDHANDGGGQCQGGNDDGETLNLLLQDGGFFGALVSHLCHLPHQSSVTGLEDHPNGSSLNNPYPKQRKLEPKIERGSEEKAYTVPISAMLQESKARASVESTDPETGIDSPVTELLSILIELTSTRRTSAGILFPGVKVTTSP